MPQCLHTQCLYYATGQKECLSSTIIHFSATPITYNNVMISLLRLVYNMTQGFALRCVATRSAYKMIWTATQRRNRKNFYSCIASPSKSFCMHFRSRRNAAQPLRHIINQPLCFSSSSFIDESYLVMNYE